MAVHLRAYRQVYCVPMAIRFGALGGDWDSFITARLTYSYPERLSGIHLNLMPIRRDPPLVSNPT
jgi:microsomal epoxide hydrolase